MAQHINVLTLEDGQNYQHKLFRVHKGEWKQIVEYVKISSVLKALKKGRFPSQHL